MLRKDCIRENLQIISKMQFYLVTRIALPNSYYSISLYLTSAKDTKTNSQKSEVIFDKLAQPFLQRQFSVRYFDYLLPFWYFG